MRRKRDTAPAEDSLGKAEDLIVTSREEFDEMILESQAKQEDLRLALLEVERQFIEALSRTGLKIEDQAARSLLGTLAGERFSDLAITIANVRLVTEQLHRLADESGEAPELTRKYYGLYVLLVRLVDVVSAARGFVRESRRSRPCRSFPEERRSIGIDPDRRSSLHRVSQDSSRGC